MPLIASRAGGSAGAFGGLGASVVAIAPAVAFGAFDSLASITVPSGGLTSIVFAGVPIGYEDLQIRGMVRGGSESAVLASFNGQSGAGHALYSNGTLTGSFQETTGIALGGTAASTSGANNFGVFVSDILNYASTTQNKTIRSLSGNEKDAGGGNTYVFFQSSLWQSTQPISNIVLTLAGGNTFAQNSQISLYGVK
jgi:hypothetical protein